MGFLVLTCPLKSATKSTIDLLNDCDLPSKIITGDNVFTACEVARKADMIPSQKPICILDNYHKYVFYTLL